MQHRRPLALLATCALVGACTETEVGPPDFGSIPEPTRPNALFDSPVVRAPMQLPPYFGGTVLALSDGARAVISDPDRNQIELVDLDARTQRVVALSAGDEPGRAVEDESHRVHVVLRRGGAVATIDPVEGVLVRRTAVCAAPRGIAWDASARMLHVACEGGELVTLTPDGSIARVRTVASDLRDVVVLPQGVLVSRFRAAEAVLVRPDGTQTRIERPAPTVGVRGARATMVAWSMVSDGTHAWMVHQDASLAALAVPQASEPAPPGGSYGGSGVTSRPDVGEPSTSIVSELTDLDGAQPRWVEQTPAQLRGPAIDMALDATRRTPSLRGGILATAPFHWDGDLTNVGTLMREVFTRRMGGGAVSDAQVEALGAWVDRIPAVPVAPPVDTARIARGEAIFRSAATACVTCHSGDRLTNNQSVDVGTRGAFQVPSLKGLAARAPYMHDGCATTLRQRFTNVTCGGGDRHGRTSQLSTAQLDDLVAWLETQ